MTDYSNLSANELVDILKKRDDDLQKQQQRIQTLTQNPPANTIIQIQPSIALPEPWNLKNQDISQSFEIFMENWNIYKVATAIQTLPEAQQTAIFWSALGSAAIHQCHTNWNFSQDERRNTESIITAIRAKLTSQRIPIVDRVNFGNCERNTDSDETIVEFVKRAETLADYCNFGANRDEMLLQQVIRGMKDLGLQKDLLSTANITWENAKQKIVAKKLCDTQLQVINPIKQEPQDVKKIKKKISSGKAIKRKCWYCNTVHELIKEKCPAYGKTCKYCKKPNHNEAACKKKKRDENTESSEEEEEEIPKSSKAKKNEISKQCKRIYDTDDSAESDSDYLTIKTITFNSAKFANTDLQLKIQGKYKSVNCQLDTGSDCNLIGLANLTELIPNPTIIQNKVQLKDIQLNTIESLGEIRIPCNHNDTKYALSFQVVKFPQKPLLSENTCTTLKLIEYCQV